GIRDLIVTGVQTCALPIYRGLRGERVSVDGITSEEELVDRVVREPITVVRIGMAAGESVDALRHQILKRVPHLPWLPIIDEASRSEERRVGKEGRSGWEAE